MKIYTKTGDQGMTSLFGGNRVSKADLRIDAYGTIDELNAWIGMVRDCPSNVNRSSVLNQFQNDLFIIGAELATVPGNTKVKIPHLAQAHISFIEQQIDALDSALPPMKSFVLPGGHHDISTCHIARTVCRRAERICTALHQVEPVDPLILQYINRLSDYLFVLSRTIANELSITETPWISNQ
jgi:cob(I)alamin adenosyltransferase